MSTDDDFYGLAPPGQVFVCAACGKTSQTRSGWLSDTKRAGSSRGWDESCTMHAVLCYDRKPWEAVPEKQNGL